MIRTVRRDSELCHLGDLISVPFDQLGPRILQTNVRCWDRTVVFGVDYADTVNDGKKAIIVKITRVGEGMG